MARVSAVMARRDVLIAGASRRAQLLDRVFGVDVPECAEMQGRMKVLALVTRQPAVPAVHTCR